MRFIDDSWTMDGLWMDYGWTMDGRWMDDAWTMAGWIGDLNRDMVIDPYHLFNLPLTASNQEIKNAYLKLACQAHPCSLSSNHSVRNPQSWKFDLAAQAFTLIGFESNRPIYDLARQQILRQSGDLGHINSHSTRNSASSTSSASSASLDSINAQSSWNDHQLLDALPPALRVRLESIDPFKVFNDLISQIDKDRQNHFQSPLIHHQPNYHQQNLKPVHHNDTQIKNTNSKLSSSKLNQSHLMPIPTIHYNLDESANKLNLSEPITFQSNKTSSNGLSESFKHQNSKLKTDNLSLTSNSSTNSNSTSRSKTRRVSFSNDVIASEELKLAREAVLSFKAEAVRQSNHSSSRLSKPLQNHDPHHSTFNRPHSHSLSSSSYPFSARPLYSSHVNHDHSSIHPFSNPDLYHTTKPIGHQFGSRSSDWKIGSVPQDIPSRKKSDINNERDTQAGWSRSAPSGLLYQLLENEESPGFASHVNFNPPLPCSSARLNNSLALAPSLQGRQRSRSSVTDNRISSAIGDLSTLHLDFDRQTSVKVSNMTTTISMKSRQEGQSQSQTVRGQNDFQKEPIETRKAIEDLLRFLEEIDGKSGAYDRTMGETLYYGGIKKKEWLLEMSEEELREVMMRIEEDNKATSDNDRCSQDDQHAQKEGKQIDNKYDHLNRFKPNIGLTPFQIATLPRRLKDWKLKNRYHY
ncbi:hypothetical protein O181_009920 [Austropuccinia psidii MF-1]|uniref:J domain-containing protein n=1 Tax=Austropuccinia psidii MF-1 TaxID=1389203 RepID=A0A9Q3BSW4_9BASI|nr:hypothetical protein [Austropuccinia psidii MF-1]